MMRLSEFKYLIANMPVSYQAFESKCSTWKSYISCNDSAGNALRSVFRECRDGDRVTLSRSDLRDLACESDLAEFVIATIIWGYPRGMRGNNFANLIRHLGELTQLLSAARTQPVAEWATHYKKVERIPGVGLSTYTKFLNFLSVQVQGHPALILDDRIIQVASQPVFEDLTPLKEELTNHYKPARSYPKYLELMDRLANSLKVSAEQIEFFLFEFGVNLKPPPAGKINPANAPRHCCHH